MAATSNPFHLSAGSEPASGLPSSPVRLGTSNVPGSLVTPRRTQRRNSMKSTAALESFSATLTSQVSPPPPPPGPPPRTTKPVHLAQPKDDVSVVVSPIHVAKRNAKADPGTGAPLRVVTAGVAVPTIPQPASPSQDVFVTPTATPKTQRRSSQQGTSFAHRWMAARSEGGPRWQSLALPDYLFHSDGGTEQLPRIEAHNSSMAPAEAKFTAFLCKLRAYCEAASGVSPEPTPSPPRPTVVTRKLSSERLKVFSGAKRSPGAIITDGSTVMLSPLVTSQGTPNLPRRGSTVYRSVREEDKEEVGAAADKWRELLDVTSTWNRVQQDRTRTASLSQESDAIAAPVVTEIQSLSDRIQAILSRPDPLPRPPSPPLPPPPPPLPVSVIDLTKDEPTLSPVVDPARQPVVSNKTVASLARKWKSIARKSVVTATGHAIEMSSLMTRWEHQRALGVLRHAGSWFADVTESDARYMIETCTLLQYKKNDYIVVQGTTGTSMYIILEGEVSILTAENHVEKELMRRFHGQIFGEFALITDGIRAANVKAISDVKVLEMTRQTYEIIEATMPQSSLMATLAKLLRQGK